MAPAGIPALQGIIAKVLVLVEKVLDEFVDISMMDFNVHGGGNNVCLADYFSGTTTYCGGQLVDLWANILFVISNLVASLLAALGVYVS